MLPSGRTLRARRFAPVHLAPLGSIYDIQRAVADKATEWEMSNDEFGMSNRLNFGLRTSAFALPPALVGDPKRIALVAAGLVAHLTPSPPAQSGCAQRSALSVSRSPLAEFGSRSAWRRWTARPLSCA